METRNPSKLMYSVTSLPSVSSSIHYIATYWKRAFAKQSNLYSHAMTHLILSFIQSLRQRP